MFISPSARMARNVSSAFSAFSIRSWYLEKSQFAVRISLSILSVSTASSITSYLFSKILSNSAATMTSSFVRTLFAFSTCFTRKFYKNFFCLIFLAFLYFMSFYFWRQNDISNNLTSTSILLSKCLL